MGTFLSGLGPSPCVSANTKGPSPCVSRVFSGWNEEPSPVPFSCPDIRLSASLILSFVYFFSRSRILLFCILFARGILIPKSPYPYYCANGDQYIHKYINHFFLLQ